MTTPGCKWVRPLLAVGSVRIPTAATLAVVTRQGLHVARTPAKKENHWNIWSRFVGEFFSPLSTASEFAWHRSGCPTPAPLLDPLLTPIWRRCGFDPQSSRRQGAVSVQNRVCYRLKSKTLCSCFCPNHFLRFLPIYFVSDSLSFILLHKCHESLDKMVATKIEFMNALNLEKARNLFCSQSDY